MRNSIPESGVADAETICTGVKQCIFYRLIFKDIAQNEIVLNSLILHHLIMITCISSEIMFTICLPKLVNIAPV